MERRAGTVIIPRGESSLRHARFDNPTRSRLVRGSPSRTLAEQRIGPPGASIASLQDTRLWRFPGPGQRCGSVRPTRELVRSNLPGPAPGVAEPLAFRQVGFTASELSFNALRSSSPSAAPRSAAKQRSARCMHQLRGILIDTNCGGTRVSGYRLVSRRCRHRQLRARLHP
jgi:hypothetical protein